MLLRIIPTVPTTGGRWGTKLDWAKYFATHPFDAPLLGYDIRDKNPQLWNRNNVLARDLLDRGMVPTPQSNGAPPPPAPKGELLKKTEDRRALLHKIVPLLEKSSTGQQSWKTYFADHPEEAHALGYDLIQTNHKIWAANLRISQQRTFRREAQENNPVAADKPDTYDIQLRELETRNRELKEQLRESETKLAECRALLNVSKEIVFDLTVQLRELRA